MKTLSASLRLCGGFPCFRRADPAMSAEKKLLKVRIRSKLDTDHRLQNTRVTEVSRARLGYGAESGYVERAVWIPAQSRSCDRRRPCDDPVRLRVRAESQITIES
jgi:hypothetical protein